MQENQMTLPEALDMILSVLRPEMRQAAYIGMVHYIVQAEAEERATSEDNYYEILEKAGYQMPTLLQNWWKSWIAGYVSCWEAGECNQTIEESQSLALKQQAYLDELIAQGADPNETAE